MASLTSAGLTSSSGSQTASPALVVVPGAVLRILDVYPGSKKSNKKEGENFFVPPFYVATNIIKIVNNFIFEQGKKIFWRHH